METLYHQILIVDQNKEDSGYLQTILEQRYKVVVVHSVAKALRTIKKQHFDLIISDLYFEKDNGLDLLKEVKTNFPLLPFIIVSKEFSDKESLAAVQLGVTNYLVKPVDQNMILDIAQRSIKQFKNRYVKHSDAEYTMENQYRAVIKNNESSILKLLDTTDNIIELLYPYEAGSFPDLKIAIYEGLTNAKEHGNQDSNNVIRFGLEMKIDRIIVHIKDQGFGFNYKPYFQKEKLQEYSGISMMCHLMDEVVYNRMGNELSLLKIIN